MSDNHDEQRQEIELPGDRPEVEQPVPEGSQAPPAPELFIHVQFQGIDSAAFHYQRSDGISPWMMAGLIAHLKAENEMDLQTWLIQRRQEQLAMQPKLVVPPAQVHRGVREVFSRGRWKPPAERKG